MTGCIDLGIGFNKLLDYLQVPLLRCYHEYCVSFMIGCIDLGFGLNQFFDYL